MNLINTPGFLIKSEDSLAILSKSKLKEDEQL